MIVAFPGHTHLLFDFSLIIWQLSLLRLYGDYETLATGRTADALVDFSGGVAETLKLAKLNLDDFNSQIELFTKLKEASENKALINCNIDVSDVDARNQRDRDSGSGHPPPKLPEKSQSYRVP